MVVVITLGDLGHTDAGDTACLLTDDSLLSYDGTLWYISTVMDTLLQTDNNEWVKV